MIYITGDTHGDIDYHKLKDENFKIQNTLTRNDYVIVCGDMGVVWGKNDDIIQEFYSSRNVTTLFVDGNHENFDKLNSYKRQMWNGGEVSFIKDNLIHLRRGQVYTIDGIKVFTLGGANSIDYKLRTPGISWWKEEMPNEQEYQIAMENLKKHDYKVDLVITHSAPYKYLTLINPYIVGNDLNYRLDEIENKLDYKAWFLGHYHINKALSGRIKVIYNDIYSIDKDLNIQKYEEDYHEEINY